MNTAKRNRYLSVSLKGFLAGCVTGVAAVWSQYLWLTVIAGALNAVAFAAFVGGLFMALREIFLKNGNENRSPNNTSELTSGGRADAPPGGSST